MGEIAKPFASILHNGERLSVTRDNLTLNRHLGKFAVFDHCFIHPPVGGGGAYLWVYVPGFEELEREAYKHHARINLNIKKPSDYTIKNYMAQATMDLEDAFTLPEEWLR